MQCVDEVEEHLALLFAQFSVSKVVLRSFVLCDASSDCMLKKSMQSSNSSEHRIGRVDELEQDIA